MTLILRNARVWDAGGLVQRDVAVAGERVSQVGAGSMILAQPHDFGTGQAAQLVVKIDGRPITENVIVSGGATRFAQYHKQG